MVFGPPQGHVQRVVREFRVYFNEHQTPAGMDALPAPKAESGYVTEKPAGGKLVAIPHMNGLVYNFRQSRNTNFVEME